MDKKGLAIALATTLYFDSTYQIIIIIIYVKPESHPAREDQRRLTHVATAGTERACPRGEDRLGRRSIDEAGRGHADVRKSELHDREILDRLWISSSVAGWPRTFQNQTERNSAFPRRQ